MMNNKLGISIASAPELSFDENVGELARAGFVSSFLGWNKDIDLFERAKVFDRHHIEIDNLHAPFKGLNCIWREGTEGDDYVEYLSECLDDAATLHVPRVVMHPVCGEDFPLSSLIGIERFKKLVDRSLNKGVKICFENVEYSEMLGIVMAEFGDDVGFCYDVGHEATNDPGMRFLKLYGDRLSCTHIHDNYGISYLVTPVLHGDCHMIPLDATIDFKRVMRDIKDTGYRGTLMLECARGHYCVRTYLDISLREYYERAHTALLKISSFDDEEYSSVGENDGWSGIYRP